MVAPESNVANTPSDSINHYPHPTANDYMDTRGRPMSRISVGQTKEDSIASCTSNSSASAMSYCERVALENNAADNFSLTPGASWADQMDVFPPSGNIEEVSIPSFQFHTQPKGLHAENTHTSHAPNTPHEAHMPITPTAIPYEENQPADPDLWDGNFGAVSIFGTKECFECDTANISLSLHRAATYIRQRDLSGGDPNTLPQLLAFGNAAWNLLTAIYASQWDKLHTIDGTSFRDRVSAQQRRS